MRPDEPEEQGHLIAVVGMAGRFPGAPDIETFWENLCAGRDLSLPCDARDPFEAARRDVERR